MKVKNNASSSTSVKKKQEKNKKYKLQSTATFLIIIIINCVGQTHYFILSYMQTCICMYVCVCFFNHS